MCPCASHDGLFQLTYNLSVVFSYRTAVLDLANAALSTAGIGCVQIDGKSSPKMRSQAISVFSKNETTQVLLLSLGCGAVG